MTRLIQIERGEVRRVALVKEPSLHLLEGCSSIYELANLAVTSGVGLTNLAQQRAGREELEYDPVYRGDSEWHILAAIDHPQESARCNVPGTALTHLGRARRRNAMR